MSCYNGVQEPVTAAVWYVLNNYCYNDAIFIAERLHAEVHSMDTTFLLATCYYRSGRLQQTKHLLSKERDLVLTHRQCVLLYAQCCLDLKEYKEGLLAINGVLALQESLEDDLHADFGADVGMAFLLLGKLKYNLQHKQDAACCFRAALKFNPFLWSAFEMLCEMGEEVCPDECFKISNYPGFLRPHPLSAPPTLAQFFTAQAKTSTAKTTDHPMLKRDDLNLICAESPSTDNNCHVSTFEPVGNNPLFMTPDIFHEPSVGKAIASSTPTAPRGISAQENLTVATEPSINRKDHLSTMEVESRVGLGWSHSTMGQIKGALDFGSTGSQCRIPPAGRAVATPTVTPLNPSFGVLSLVTPATGGELPLVRGIEQTLDFSTVTPSPTPLPINYLKILQSAPKSKPAFTKLSRGQHATFEQPSLTSSAPRTELPSSRTGSHLPIPVRKPDTPHPLTKVITALEQPSRSKRVMTAPHSEKKDPAMKGPAPLRRSVRLSGSTNKRLSDHAIHSTRCKSRLKSPTSVRRNLMDGSTKKGSKGVTFNTSIKTRGSSSSSVTPTSSVSPKRSPKAQLLSSSSVGMTSMGNMTHPLSPPLAANILASNQNTENLQRTTGDGREGVVTEGKEVEKKENILGVAEEEVKGIHEAFMTQQLLEQSAMTGLTSLMKLLSFIGQAYQALMIFDLEQAIRLFLSLPPHQQETPWVLGQVAKAYFAAERFKKSAKVFKQVHDMDPHRQEGMELYSSSLWHLQYEVELSVLAHQLYSSHKFSPEGMCAMASLKNLHKENETAISFLTRAIQVCPDFAYAHTLLGHEYWLAKDYDKALSSFQSATAIQPRHYNAWYGMAHVSFAQEKYKAAEVYASKALSINGCSSISCTQMGLAQLRQSCHKEALASFDRALSINPLNPIPRFHKTKALESMGLLEEALKELDILAKSWPKEPNLFITRGKILKRLDRTHEAALQLSWALNFSRSGTNSQLREEIDQAYHNQNTSDSGNDESDVYILPVDDPTSDEEEREDNESDSSVRMD